MLTLLYIHGFASTGDSPKVTALKQHFKSCRVIAPTLPTDVKSAFAALDTIIREEAIKGNSLYLIGTSLGGLMADIVSGEWDIPAFIINPSNVPSMKKYIGQHTRYSTGEVFSFTEEDVAELEKRIKDFDRPKGHIRCVVAADDEVIDPHAAIARYGAKVFENQGHRFNDISILFPEMEDHISSVK